MSDEKPVREQADTARVDDATPETAAAGAVDAAPADVEVAPAGAEPVPVTDAAASVGAESPDAPVETPAAPATEARPEAPTHQVVYVETAPPPRKRGNRIIGVLLAVLGAVVFAAVYAVVAALMLFLDGDAFFGHRFGTFVSSSLFWVPILVFVLAFILEVVIVNRAGWAAHVFGSLLLAFVVYFASIGLLLLVGNVFLHQSLAFSAVALVPQVIAAAVIAREVAIWFGLAIAARGRRVRARNIQAREQYDRELAERRAQYENRPAERVE
jgi:hypothetical protein